MNPADISIKDYTYDLPEEKIAFHPLQQRDASKLLVYKDGDIKESRFSNLANHLPADTLLVFNNTKVINARIEFRKATGARIEIFCLEPYGSITEYSKVMTTQGTIQWKCFVGGAAKWKEELLEKELIIDGKTVHLFARKIGQTAEAFVIEFSWKPVQLSFAAIIEAGGDTPLPPYIKRSAELSDHSRYQTVYADAEGSVAAPTAGLHFTEALFDKLAQKNIERSFVTLHVGAGTFKPVKAETMEGHEMHSEYIDVDKGFIENLAATSRQIAAVGTTSLRTIETLYWLGCKAFINPAIKEFSLLQWEVYDAELAGKTISKTVAMQALITWLNANKQERIFTKTQILIAPGYRFRMADMLITNFHQPQSTLLLLVAAAIGDDWRKMYDYALNNEFRFLSYGDGNLIFINSKQQV